MEPARKALGLDSGNASFEAQTDGFPEDREIHRIRAIVKSKQPWGEGSTANTCAGKRPKGYLAIEQP